MSLKRTLLMLIILALVLGYYLYYEVHYKKQKQLEESEAKKIFRMIEEEVTAVLVQEGEERVVVQKEDDKWMVTEPIRTDADENNVINLIFDLLELNSADEIALADVSEDSLKAFGFSSEPYILGLKREGEDDFTEVIIGGMTPTYKRFYLRRPEEDKILSINGNRAGIVDKNLYEMRNKQAIDLPGEEEIDRIEISKKDDVVTLERGDDGKWSITSPQFIVADQDKVSQFIDGVDNLRALAFVTDYSPNEADLEPPRIKLSFFKKDAEKPDMLLIGKDYIVGDRSDENWGPLAMREGGKEIFMLRAKAIYTLPLDSIGFQSLKLFVDDPLKIYSVAVQNEKNDFIIKQIRDNEYEVEGEPSLRVDKTKASRMFSDLAIIEGVNVFLIKEGADLASIGLNPPQGSINVAPIAGESVQLFVGKEFQRDARLIYVRVKDSDKVFLVEKRYLASLLPDKEYFRDRHVLPNSKYWNLKTVSAEYNNDKYIFKRDYRNDWIAIQRPEDKIYGHTSIVGIITRFNELRFVGKPILEIGEEIDTAFESPVLAVDFLGDDELVFAEVEMALDPKKEDIYLLRDAKQKIVYRIEKSVGDLIVDFFASSPI